jgi:hypothetical protein
MPRDASPSDPEKTLVFIGLQTNGQKKPGLVEAGLEAFLLSHTKAPAQGGKAGGVERQPGREYKTENARFARTDGKTSLLKMLPQKG